MPGAWRDSAISHLDSIAATNEQQILLPRRGRMAWMVALSGVALVALILLARSARDEAPATAAARPAPDRLLAVTTVATLPATPTPPQAAAPEASPATVAAPAATPAAEPAAEPAAVVGTETEDATRKARAAQQQSAIARRAKANELAQERARASEDAQRQQRALEQQQAQAELARQQVLLSERERAAAAERSRQEAALLAQASRRDVQAVCAASSGGFIGEQLCHSRECRKPERHGDAVCERLRDFEVARLLRGSDH